MTKKYNGVKAAHSLYGEWRCVVLESDQIKVIVIPDLGAKIVSLQHKLTGKEWLVDSGVRNLQQMAYGSGFGQADMSGWDECFPTIDPCTYPIKGAYTNRFLPDHGEVWSLPWDAEILDGTLICKVRGRELPYEFTRTMYFVHDHVLRFHYKVANMGMEPLAVLWTAHPQFITTEHTRIRLPAEVNRLLCVHGGRTLNKGCIYEWPAANSADLAELRLDRIGPAHRGDSRKFYVNDRLESGWAGLYEQNSGEYLKMVWSPAQLPYLGIWIDEGHFNDRAVCALEPSNGFYDNLSEAAARGNTLLVQPGAETEWQLEVRLGCGSPSEMEQPASDPHESGESRSIDRK